MSKCYILSKYHRRQSIVLAISEPIWKIFKLFCTFLGVKYRVLIKIKNRGKLGESKRISSSWWISLVAFSSISLLFWNYFLTFLLIYAIIIKNFSFCKHSRIVNENLYITVILGEGEGFSFFQFFVVNVQNSPPLFEIWIFSMKRKGLLKWVNYFMDWKKRHFHYRSLVLNCLNKAENLFLNTRDENFLFNLTNKNWKVPMKNDCSGFE